jgi:hypothetical protein
MDPIVPPQRVARVRRLYAEGVHVKTILAETRMARAVLYRCLAGDFDDGSGAKPAPLPLRAAGKRGRTVDRAKLIARLWRTAERQIAEIDARLKAAGLEITEQEGNARTFAIVVKTLRELSALDERKAAHGRDGADDGHGEPFPENVDELRLALARKLQGLIAERRGLDCEQAERDRT